MRPTLTSIVCFTLFVLTHSAPAQKRCCEPGPTCFDPCPPQDIEQADLAPGADEFAFAPLSQQGEEGEQDDQDDQSLMMNDCCEPGPTCSNPCQQGPPPQQFAASLPPPPPVAPMLPPPPPPVAPMLPPQPPPPIYTGNSNCCQPGPTCNDPCPAPFMAPPIAPPMPAPMSAPMPPPSFQTPMAPPMAPPMGGPIDPCCDPGMVQGCANPCAPPAQPEPPKSYAPYPGEITFKLQQTWDVDKYLNEKTPAFQILAGNLKNAIKDVLGPMTTTSNIYFREGYVPGNPSTMPKVVAHVMVNGGSDDASILQRAVTPDGTLGDGLKVYKDSFNAY